MKIYELANADFRISVDLLEYKDIIEYIIAEEAPSVKVTVESHRYIVEPDISKGTAIRIGRRIARSELGKYCMPRFILFVGHSLEQSVERSVKDGTRKRKFDTDNKEGKEAGTS